MALRLSCCLTRGFYKHTLRRTVNYQRLALVQQSSRHMSAMSDQFNQAKENVAKLTQDPGNEMKLKMYALFKQVLRLWSLNQVAPKPSWIGYSYVTYV